MGSSTAIIASLSKPARSTSSRPESMAAYRQSIRPDPDWMRSGFPPVESVPLHDGMGCTQPVLLLYHRRIDWRMGVAWKTAFSARCLPVK
jgi:hypothetical protein